jgi:3-vinyl bacteriochlorophyllide hydratase
MFAPTVFGRMMDAVDCAPWGATAGRHVPDAEPGTSFLPLRRERGRPLYTPDQKQRRDASPWTLVQGVLAPVQFLVFAVSLSLVLRYLLTGGGEHAATLSVVIKTFALYTIMVTGAIWEHKIFGKYLFAPAFFWEDAVSMVVIALHTAYLAALLTGALDTQSLMLLALAAYVTYVVNAAQFVLKLRAARLADSAQHTGWRADQSHHGMGHA